MSVEWIEIGPCRIACGDCLEILPTMEAGSVDAVVTSPPYAEQRKAQYGGVRESDYPEWTVRWLSSARLSMTQDANVLINIREHVKDGQLSDYVHQTRMRLRDVFVECDELIWVKPDAPPLGDPARPRRSWERVLWFSPSNRPSLDPRGNGKKSDRIGWDREKVEWISSRQTPIVSGTARHTDVCSVPVCKDEFGHPAAYPVEFVEWMLNGWCDACAVDPFMGSGTTGVACIRTGRKFIGIEKEEKYFQIAAKRLRQAWVEKQSELPFPKEETLTQRGLSYE